MLLSFGRAELPLRVSFLAMVAKVSLAFLLVPTLGYLAEAALFSAYFVISVSVLVLYGMAEIRKRSRLDPGLTE